jgi:hypothetical protein
MKKLSLEKLDNRLFTQLDPSERVSPVGGVSFVVTYRSTLLKVQDKIPIDSFQDN